MLRNKNFLMLLFVDLACLLIPKLSLAGLQDNSPKLSSCCGTNCAYIILHMADKPIKLKQILANPIVRKTPDLSLLDLKNILKKFGHEMIAVSISTDQVMKLSRPFIAHMAPPLKSKNAHYVVCWVAKPDELDITDYPKRGRVSLERFGNYYTGYALISALENIHNSSTVITTQYSKKKQSKNHNTNKLKNQLQSITTKDAKFVWIDSNVLEIGTMQESKDLRTHYDFRFKNIGKESLMLSDIISSCSCAKAEFSSYCIPPSEIGVLSVEVKKTLEGPFKEHVRFKTNDPNFPSPRVVIRGEFVPLVSITMTPSNCVFDNTKKERLYVKKIILNNPVRRTQQELHIKDIIVGLSDYVTVSISKPWYIEKYPKLRIRKCELEVKLKHNLPPDTYNDQITLKCEPKDVIIPLSIVVEPAVVSRPSICFLQIDKEHNNTSKTIAFETEEKEGFILQKVSTNASWLKCYLEEDSSKVSKKRFVTIFAERDRGKSVKGLMKAKIKATGYVNNEPWEQLIPVVCVLSE